MGGKKKIYRQDPHFRSVVRTNRKRHASPHLIKRVRIALCATGLMIAALFVVFINLF